ncbi:choice-of-anchor I family protein [Marinobacter sp. MBR-105]
MPKTSHPFRLSLLALAVSTVLVSGCNSSDNDDDPAPEAQVTGLKLEFAGRYSTGQFDESAAEITAFDAASRRAFVVNALSGAVDVLDMSDPANPAKIDTLTVADIAADAVVNSVAVANGLVAVAVESNPKTDAGYVAVFGAADLQLRDSILVGAQPDMVTFTPDGRYVLAANEGEPSDDYQIDPEGSISVVDVSNPASLTVRTADFLAFNSQESALKASGVRIYGPGATVAQDLEPEYITVSADSRTAWVSLQENNALAKLDIDTATVTDILPLGFKDYGVEGQGIDASDDDGVINIQAWPGVVGIYHPDAITSYDVDGATYIVTANEGDARAWGEDNADYWNGDSSKGFVEELRVKHLVHPDGFARRVGDDMPPQLTALAEGALLNPEVFEYCGATAGAANACRDDDQLGRLNISWVQGYRVAENGDPVMFNASGAEDPDGTLLMYDTLYSYGARSLAIWNEDGELVWDSGDAIEQFLASDECRLGTDRSIPCSEHFNSAHDEGMAFDSRSDAKGPEPEAVTVATFGNKTFAFLGLERMGGILVYDVTDPASPVQVDYLNTRDDWTTVDTASVLETAGDLGVESITVVSSDDSPSGEPLLITGNEVSGTTAIYRVKLELTD